ncbi:MAG TPA: hypothetical protein VG963_14100 [Polyangiaceae bacterium]|nr:hypothetical protein [Polyangiaceae bacterium]
MITRRIAVALLASLLVPAARADCALTFGRFCVFDPANVLIEGEASWQISGDFTYTLAAQTYRGSIGRLAVSVDVPIRSHFTVRYGIEHRSYIETNRDRGEERGFVGFQWRPFR